MCGGVLAPIGRLQWLVFVRSTVAMAPNKRLVKWRWNGGGKRARKQLIFLLSQNLAKSALRLRLPVKAPPPWPLQDSEGASDRHMRVLVRVASVLSLACPPLSLPRLKAVQYFIVGQ